MRLHWLRGALALITLALAASVAVGCSSDDEAAVDPAGTTGGETGSTTGGAPAFNYVPLNDDVCEPGESRDQQIAIARKLGSLNLDYTTGAATGLSLCAACEGNGFLDLLSATTTEITIADKAVSGDLVAHVNDSLAFPFRELLVSWTEDADGDFDIALVQGIRTDPGEYEVQVESLATGCTDFDITMFATVTRTSNDEGEVVSAETASSSDKPFGFIVPAELPDTDGATDEEVAEALDAANGLGIRMEDPSVDFEVDEDGNGNGTLTGYIQLGSLTAFSDAGIDLSMYASEADPNRIKAALSFAVEPANTVSAIDLETLLDTEDVEDDVAPAGKPGKADNHTLVKGACKNCKPIGKQALCSGAAQTETDLRAVHVMGAAGTFTISGELGAGPRILRKALPNGAMVIRQKDQDKAEEGESPAEATFVFRRPWRPGAGYAVRPPCVDTIANGEAPEELLQEDGWVEVRWRPIGELKGGCSRSIWVCQEFAPAACGPNTQVDEDGQCACQDGFEAAFDTCIDRAPLGFHPKAELGKDENGDVSASCPEGMLGDGKTCMKDPCDVDPCGDGEACSVAEMLADGFTCESLEDEEEAEEVPSFHNLIARYRADAGGKADGHVVADEIDDSVSDSDDEEYDDAEIMEALEDAPEENEDNSTAADSEEIADDEGSSKPSLSTQTGALGKYQRRKRKRRKRRRTVLNRLQFRGQTADGKWKTISIPAIHKNRIGKRRSGGKIKRINIGGTTRRHKMRRSGRSTILQAHLAKSALAELKANGFKPRMMRYTKTSYNTGQLIRGNRRARRAGRTKTSWLKVRAFKMSKGRIGVAAQSKAKYAKRSRKVKRRRSHRSYRRSNLARLSKTKRISRMKRKYRQRARRAKRGRRMRRR